MYINAKKAYFVLLTLLVAHISFVTISSRLVSNYDDKIYNLSLFTLVLMLPYIQVLIQKKYLTFNCLFLLMCGSMFLSAIVNKGKLTIMIEPSLVFILRIMAFVFFWEISDYAGVLFKNLKLLFYIIVFYCLLSDVLMIVAPNRTYYLNDYYDDFLVGSKFSLSYLHLWMVLLYSTIFKKFDKIFYGLMALTFVVSLHSGCSTMVVGTAIIAILFIFRKYIGTILHNNIVLLIVLIVSSVILVFGSFVLQIPMIQNFIINVLHENATLSGRLNIYERYGSLLLVNPIWGVSYDANYKFSMFYTGAANFQNGIVDVFVSFGLLGVVIFLVMLFSANRASKKINDYIFVNAIYMFVMLASVEIPFRTNMYILLSMVILLSKGWDRNELQGE